MFIVESQNTKRRYICENSEDVGIFFAGRIVSKYKVYLVKDITEYIAGVSDVYIITQTLQTIELGSDNPRKA